MRGVPALRLLGLVAVSTTLTHVLARGQSAVYVGVTPRGCWRAPDCGTALLAHLARSSDAMCLRVCAEDCALAGYAYMGIRDSKECWCGSTNEDFAVYGDATCDRVCSEGASLTCGGVEAMSVYSIAYSNLYVCESVAERTELTCASGIVKVLGAKFDADIVGHCGFQGNASAVPGSCDFTAANSRAVATLQARCEGAVQCSFGVQDVAIAFSKYLSAREGCGAAQGTERLLDVNFQCVARSTDTACGNKK